MPPPVPGTGASSRFVQQGPYVAQPVGYHQAEEKSVAVAYLLWFFLGWFGGHHFYLGNIGKGFGYFFTVAWFTVGWWIDLFTLPGQVGRINFERRAGLR